MLNFIPFYTKIWSDKKFKQLHLDSRLLFIYLFANDNVSLSGIYELDRDTAIAKLKLPRDLEQLMEEIVNVGLLKWDSPKDMVFVTNRFKLIPNKSPKVIQGVINELNIISHPFKEEFIKAYKDYLKDYIPNLKGYEDKDYDLLNKEQLLAFQKLGWQRERLKKFYIDREYPEKKIDEIIAQILPNLK